ncbi:MAG: heme o synthase [Pseudomonadota bacterium]|nr:heme o synthase [Pseudomonadota bacterium]
MSVSIIQRGNTLTETLITLQYYGQLCKSKVVMVMLSASLVGMLITPNHYHNIPTMLAGLLGIGMCACAGAACNHLLESNIDQKMTRTAKRPLANQKISSLSVCIFGCILLSLGVLILYNYTNLLTTKLTLATTIGYAYIYTRWLKPATPQNIVIGGLSGAMPPLLGWTSLTNSISAEPLLLVLIIFTWTPAHFWPLAIHNINDYQKAQLPMLPNTHGIAFTKVAILAYAYLTSAVSLLPFCIGSQSYFYLMGTVVLNIYWLYLSHKLQRNTQIAMQVFSFSIKYIMGLFCLILLDHTIVSYHAYFSFF